MRRNNLIRKYLLTSVIFTNLCITSCTKTPLTVDYHNLSTDVSHSSKLTKFSSTLLIGPVRVNSFLTQGPIVKQHSPHSANLLEQHHWAGNLNEMLSNTLIQNLIIELGSEKIYSFPDTSSENGMRLILHFSHFEEDHDGNALLQARWNIVSNSDRTILYSSSTTKTRIPEEAGYDGLATALSKCLADLGGEIANDIRQILSTPLPTQETQQ
jgi:uncharacterized lipoprotein YmbA